MRSISGLFGRSPFGPLAQHTERVHDTVLLTRTLFEAFVESDWARTQAVYEEISKLEHKADILKNDIRDHLPKSLFLPVDRGDILLFLKEQDKIADAVEDVAVILTMRQTPTPESVRAPLFEMIDAVVRTSEKWFETAHEIPVLQETSFTGPEVQKVLERINEISDLEWEADKCQARVAKEILANEETLGAISVMFWMNIVREVGAIANRAESTADLLRVMLAKR